MSSPGVHGRGVLVFEPEHAGHQPGWVRMLAQWLVERRPDTRVNFAVSRRLLERLRAEDGFDLRAHAGIGVLELQPAQVEACCSGPLPLRSLRRMQVLRELTRRSGAAHAVALFLDPLQLALAIGGRLPGRAELSGILFRPSVHPIYRSGGAGAPGERWRDARKRWLYRRMLRNPALRRVLSLDPYFVSYAAAELDVAPQIAALPDPIVQAPATTAPDECADDVRDAAAGAGALFTLFGALTERKGVLQVLEALAQLPPDAGDGIRVVLAGKLDPAIAQPVRSRVAALPAARASRDSLRIIDRYLTTAELAWLVRRSSVILAPYQRFVGSSGVLGWAAAERKPVIAQAYGLIGALVDDFGLGLAVDTTDPARIAQAMARLSRPEEIESVARAARWHDFCAGHGPADFAAAVFAGLLEPGGRLP